ncbi:MAG: hypothetical protein ABIG94_01625 [Pseudomonadota bacterium]
MNFPQKVAVAITDVAVIAELALSIYLANQDPMNFTEVFFKNFLWMVIPTLILAWIVIKKMRTEEPPEAP